MVAAAMGRISVCLDLIKRGVNVNHKDSSSLQHTALTLAAEAGHADVVSSFLCRVWDEMVVKLHTIFLTKNHAALIFAELQHLQLCFIFC